jgi:CRP-like cAMP-binding protein
MGTLPRKNGNLTWALSDDVARVAEKAFPRSRHETRQALVELAEVRGFAAGETVTPQGEETRIVLVIDGYVGLRRTTVDGREVIPRMVSTGELAALMSMARRPAAAEAVALSECQVALWLGIDAQILAAADVGFALDLLDHVLLAFEAVVERLDGLMYQNAARRVARVLEQYSEILFGDSAVLTRAHLPALVGTSREMTGRVLRRLESEGIIQRIGRDRLRLLDADGLSRMAAPRSTPRERRSPEEVPRQGQ